MNVLSAAKNPGEPWYRDSRFPLVPRWWFRPENDQSRCDWGFSWLFLSVWTGIAFNLGAWVELSGSGLCVQFHLPWLHIRFTLFQLPHALHQKLWRVKPWSPR